MTAIRLAALGLYFVSFGCLAESLPAGVADAVKRACPNSADNFNYAVGDLDSDKVPDAAVVVGCKSSEDQEIMVLLGQPDGSYKISYRTQPWGLNQRDEIEFGINNKVITLSLHCAYDCLSESWSSKYKFKLINGQLILIGEDHGRSVDLGNQDTNENGSSVNYLTQKVIYWEKPANGAYSEKKLTFKLNAPLKFSEFNLEKMENAPLKLLGTLTPEK